MASNSSLASGRSRRNRRWPLDGRGNRLLRLRTGRMAALWPTSKMLVLLVTGLMPVLPRMDERALGLVLRLYPLTETSLIVHWLTPDFGRLATVAKGARRPKSPFAGKLDLFYLADFTFNRSRRSELHTLKEVSLRETHLFLRKELGHLRQASYCATLVELTTERETPLPRIFDLLAGLLEDMRGHPPEAQTIFAFELKLL